MKKTKHFLLAVTSVVMAVVLVLALGCGCKKKPKPDDDGDGPNGSTDTTKTLQSISLDTSDVKKNYIVGDDFSSDGLVITATFTQKGVDEAIVETLTPKSNGVTVESSEFKKNVAGTYSISVFYRYERTTRSASYDVVVINARAGLDVRLKEGQSDTLSLGDNGRIDLSQAGNLIEVRKPNGYGVIDESAAPLDPSEYTVTVYKNGNEVTGTSLTSANGGTYQIWASVDYAEVEGYTLEGFVLVYVEDKPVSIALANTAATSQVVGSTNTMNWSFVVTLSSGDTETVAANDSAITITGVNTTVIGDNKVATVTYKPGGNAGTLTTTVTYSITAPAAGQSVTINNSFNYNELKAAVAADKGTVADSTALKQSYLTGSNSFITLLEGEEGEELSQTIRDGSSSAKTCIEIKGDAISLSVQGTGKITVAFSSTGGSNVSRIGLKDSSGNLVTGGASTATAVTGEYEGAFDVTGTSYVTVTWSNLAAGTYTLWSFYTTEDAKTRGCRINALSVEDVISGDATPAMVALAVTNTEIDNEDDKVAGGDK